MDLRKKCRLTIILSIVSWMLSAISVFFMPKVSEIATFEENETPQIIVGVVFWLGILLAGIFSTVASKYRKEAVGRKKKERIGLVSFFSNKEAKVADVLMIVSILILLIAIFSKNVSDTLAMLSIFMTMTTIYIHGVLNGRNYKYIKDSAKLK